MDSLKSLTTAPRLIMILRQDTCCLSNWSCCWSNCNCDAVDETFCCWAALRTPDNCDSSSAIGSILSRVEENEFPLVEDDVRADELALDNCW